MNSTSSQQSQRSNNNKSSSSPAAAAATTTSSSVRWDLKNELERYLSDHGVESMVTALVEAICLSRPDNVAQFSIDFINHHFLQQQQQQQQQQSTTTKSNRGTVKQSFETFRFGEQQQQQSHDDDDQRMMTEEEEEQEQEQEQEQEWDMDQEALDKMRKLQQYQLKVTGGETGMETDGGRRASTPYSDKDEYDEIDFYESESRRRRYSVSVPERRGGVSAESLSVEDLNDRQRRHVVTEKSEEERSRLRDALSRVALFSSMEEDDMHIIFDAMFEKTATAGEYIIRQDDEGDNFYVVDSGHCEVYKRLTSENAGGERQKVLEIGPGDTFGELALMFGVPRAASVVAKTDCRLWALDRITYRKIIMGQTLKKRHLYEGLLRQVDILQTLNDYERLKIADALQTVTYSDGEFVVHEGGQGDKFYIVVDGELKVTKVLDGKEVELTRLHRSDYFGELALLFDQPRAATITAVGDVKLVWLDRNSFKKLLGPCQDILRRNSQLYNKYIANSI